MDTSKIASWGSLEDRPERERDARAPDRTGASWPSTAPPKVARRRVDTVTGSNVDQEEDCGRTPVDVEQRSCVQGRSTPRPTPKSQET